MTSYFVSQGVKLDFAFGPESVFSQTGLLHNWISCQAFQSEARKRCLAYQALSQSPFR